MERPQYKLQTAGSAPKRRQLKKKKKNLSRLDNGTATRQARNSGQCPEKQTIKEETWVDYTMERPKDKLETEGSAPKMIQLKKNLSRLDNGTATRQARNSRQCPEKETIKKKLESTRQWNGHKTS